MFSNPVGTSKTRFHFIKAKHYKIAWVTNTICFSGHEAVRTAQTHCLVRPVPCLWRTWPNEVFSTSWGLGYSGSFKRKRKRTMRCSRVRAGTGATTITTNTDPLCTRPPRCQEKRHTRPLAQAMAETVPEAPPNLYTSLPAQTVSKGCAKFGNTSCNRDNSAFQFPHPQRLCKTTVEVTLAHPSNLSEARIVIS